MELLNFVQSVRMAFEIEQIKRTYIGFYNFPVGACMDSSILLGLLLSRAGFGDFKIVSGWSHSAKFITHAWLEDKKYLIDLTAEQFVDWPSQSLVIDLNKKPKYYNAFEIKFKDPINQHCNFTDLGFYKVLAMIENEILK